MRFLRKLLVLGLVATAAYWAGYLNHAREMRAARVAPVKLQLVEAYPNDVRNLRPCAVPTADEAQFYEQAISLLEAVGPLTGAKHQYSFTIAGMEVLSHGVSREVGSGAVRVCEPEGIYQRAAEAIVRHRLLNAGRLVEYELELAARLPNPGPYVVDHVARVAFSGTPQQSRLFQHRDIRPIARRVLASFGREASAYGERAFQELSASDSMGTGAAMIAAASHHPGALARIEALMRDLLAEVPPDKPIPRETRNRLYELAYAILYAGPEGRDHAGPILHLMDRWVESWQMHFGMGEGRPRRMCPVVEALMGPGATAPFAYCHADHDSFEK